VTPGLFGKLPASGDFVLFDVEPAVREPLDGWLSEGMADLNGRPDGLSHYLVAPVWRFWCAPGVLGGTPVCGLVMPSVDRVGRYFPLCVVKQGAGPDSPAAADALLQQQARILPRALHERLPAMDLLALLRQCEAGEPMAGGAFEPVEGESIWCAAGHGDRHPRRVRGYGALDVGLFSALFGPPKC
jgi:type VI secretion system ImpM family protein